jgi:hypothetical protein
MRKPFGIMFALLMSTAIALAQKKVDTKWRCSIPSAFHTLPIGDSPNHSFTILQGSCRSISSKADFPEREGVYTEFQELRNLTVIVHGFMDVTMQNGDLVYYKYEGSFSPDITKPFSQRWTFAGGTGRYRSIKGRGSCAGMVHPDRTGDMECTGTLSIGM